MPSWLILVPIGLSTGVLAGMLGAGGGFATVVLLIAAGMSVHDAVGTSLVFVIAIAAWGAVVHIRAGHARGRLGIAIGLAAATTAPLGARVGHALSERTLTVSFAVLLACVAALFLLRSDRPRGSGGRAGQVRPIAGGQVAARPPLRLRMIVGAAVGGTMIGFVQGLFGVGGGFLLVPFMVMVLHVGERRAIGNSLVAIVIGGISGSISHASLGSVDVRALTFMLPGGLVGVAAGAQALRRLSPHGVRIAFVALVGISAVYLLWHGLA